MKGLLHHLAIIPDGNRRWAKAHNIGSEKQIYEQGSDTTFDILKTAFEAGIPYVTFWASSYANLLARPKLLVNAIESVFAHNFRKLTTHPLIHENQVHVDVFGEWRTILKPKTIDSIQESISATQHYDKLHLNVLIGYDGQRELGAATADLLAATKRDEVAVPKDFTDGVELIRKYAWTGRLPEVDLIIRTGSWLDPHNSASFLSLLTGNSQYAFPEVLWPDFTTEMLNNIVADFSERERRLGR